MKKFVLALALVLLPASVCPSPARPSRVSFPQKFQGPKRFEARLEQQKSKWAPNGMKVLIIHGKRRWVAGPRAPHLEKSGFVPIQKGGI